MQTKQEINGKKGESRTRNILYDYFNVLERSPDIEGGDLLVQKRFHELESLRKAKESISVYGIIQSKFFEKQNEALIDKIYIEDEEGIVTEFFAILHSDDRDNNETHYFFNAQEIKKHWKYSERKKGSYYVFKLSKNNLFEAFKNKHKNEINRRIEEGINKTEEYRNQKLIRNIENKFRNPQKETQENFKKKLFNEIKDKHITDKLYISLNVFKDFRRITSWRLIDKISFSETHHTQTYYKQFTLYTDNPEILDFFDNIDIDSEISIKNPVFFEGVTDAKLKIKKIVEILNANLVCNTGNLGRNKTRNICIKQELHCKCSDCLFDELDFQGAFLSLNNRKNTTSELWESMKDAYIQFKLGHYNEAKNLYETIRNKAKHNRDEVIYFLALYNLRIIARRNFDDNYPDLEIELSQLGVSDETREILGFLEKNTYLYDYSKTIDEFYLNIKGIKQRVEITDTSDLINRLYAKFYEYINFIDGNWLLLNNNEEFNLMVEKVIESFIISYSINTEHSNHVKHLNTSLVGMAIHFCSPNKLLGFFRQNEIKTIPYRGDNGFFNRLLTHFFSTQNIDFLYVEISIQNNRTKNPVLRNKTKQIFDNLCILYRQLDIEIKNDDLLKNATYFIDKLDLNINEIAYLAFLLFKNPKIFKNEDILGLVEVLISKGDYEGFLLANCLYTLKENEFVFESCHNDMVNTLILASLEHPYYGLIKALPKLLSFEKYAEYKTRIYESLKNGFHYELYYNSVINDLLESPLDLIDSYLNFFSSLAHDKKPQSFFDSKSPYTGVREPTRENLNNLVEVYWAINDRNLLQNPIMQNITNRFPYYNFILTIDQFDTSRPFNKFWILENQSEIVLKQLAANQYIKTILKDELTKQYHKDLSKIFIKYFSN